MARGGVRRERLDSPAMTSALPLAPLAHGGTALGDEVYALLAQAIRDGRLAPGQQLRDVDVARALGVSRTPVREALQRLARGGVVEVSANRYTRVAPHDRVLLEHAHEYLAYAAGVGLRMSLPRVDDAGLAEQLACVDRMIEASDADDFAALTAASGELYEHVARTSGNRVYVRVMQEAGLFFQRSITAWTPHLLDRAERTAVLRELRHAVAQRDGAAAERAVRRQQGIDGGDDAS